MTHTSDTELTQLTTEWLEIAAGRAAFGEGTAAEQATRFQLERLLPRTARRCMERVPPEVSRGVDALISLVGMSPQTTIIMCEALRPREILLVTSENTGPSLEAIDRWFADPARDWPRPQVRVEVVPPNDASRTSQVVRAWVTARRTERPTQRVVFDATGGKKSMSVIAGMLAVQLGLEVMYLDSAYDPSLRMPRPGSEVVVPIAVPG
jgi:hypothetical protein